MGSFTIKSGITNVAGAPATTNIGHGIVSSVSIRDSGIRSEAPEALALRTPKPEEKKPS